MENRNDFDRAANRADDARRNLEMARDDLGSAASHAGDALADAGRAMEAGASGTLERTRDAGRTAAWETAEAADRAAGIAGTAANRTVNAAENVVDRAGSMAQTAANRAGTVAQNAVHNVTDTVKGKAHDAAELVTDQAAALRYSAGEALESVRSPLIGSALGALLGSLAGALGGWWAGRKLADSDFQLTPEDEAACQAHFVALTVRPVGMTFDEARDGYALGHAASRNPGYRGRAFDQVEPELRRGFAGEYARRYATLRDFARFGYERGTGNTRGM